jgi:hypothetical protein
MKRTRQHALVMAFFPIEEAAHADISRLCHPIPPGTMTTQIMAKGAKQLYSELSDTLCDILQLVGEVSARSWRRKRLSIFPVKGNRLLHDLTQFCEDFHFIVSMASPIQQSWRAAHVALILL